MKRNAVIITAGLLDDSHAKTAHGLIRGSERFTIVGVIDSKFAGQEAGTVVDGKNRNIPVFDSIKSFRQESEYPADDCIIGVATKGGVIPDEFRPVIREALMTRMGIVSGLHQCVGEDPEFRALAEQHDVPIVDIRKPRPISELHFWKGEIADVKGPVIPVLGTDCALGKRTTAMFLKQMMKEKGHSAEMIYTGQTGWMLGNRYGFVFDSTPNDFVSGELEHAIVRCYRESAPDIMFLEGQSGLRNPSGPCGSEFIISANADGVILVHNPLRKKFVGMERYHDTIPHPKEEIALIETLGAPTLGLVINSAGMEEEEALKWKKTYQEELQIPVVVPLIEGVEELYPMLKKEIDKYRST